MPQHALLSPSSADRWSNCVGSIDLQKQVKEKEESSFAKEGTLAHDAAKLALNHPEIDLAVFSEYCDDTKTYDKEMLYYAGKWREFIYAWLRGSKDLWVEYKVYYNADVWGTVDAAALSKDGKKLLVADYKYGIGIPVWAENNHQLIIYAGCLLTLPIFKDVEHVELLIYQPRNHDVDGFDSEIYTREYITRETARMVSAGLSGKKELVAGSWCKWCRAKAICPEIKGKSQKASERAKKLLEEAEDIRGKSDEEVESLNQRISDFLTNDAPIMKDLINGMQNLAKSMIVAGETVPGFKLTRGEGHRQWNQGVNMEHLRNIGYNGDYKLPTPAQIETIIGKGKLSDLTYKPRIDVKLTADTSSVSSEVTEDLFA